MKVGVTNEYPYPHPPPLPHLLYMGQNVLIIHEHGYPNNAQWSGVLLSCMLLGNRTLLLVPMVAIVIFAQYEIEHARTQYCTRSDISSVPIWMVHCTHVHVAMLSCHYHCIPLPYCAYASCVMDRCGGKRVG